MSYPQNLDDATTEENKREIRLLNHKEENKELQVDEAYMDRLIEDDLVKDGKRRQSSDIIASYNKHRNHFSKSTAQDSDFGVRDLENLLNEDSSFLKKSHRDNNINRISSNKNRFSSVVDSIIWDKKAPVSDVTTSKI